MSKKVDLTEQRFGRLVVLRDIGKRRDKKVLWECKCDCGNITIVHSSSLRRGLTKSCGCYRREAARIAHTKHNGCYSPLYHIWKIIKSRCGNPNNKEFENYGGKGIRVCEEWKNDFAVFREWAIANGYKYMPELTRGERLSIDRIDSGGNYCPENCQWITMSENVSKANRERKTA